MTAKPRLSAKWGFMVILLIFALSISITGCTPKTASRKREQKTKPAIKAHEITKKDYNEVMRDSRLNIKLLNEVRDETQTLERFLVDPVLKQMTQQVNADVLAGKVKVRRLLKVKLKLANYTKGVAGIGMDYIDGSYYIDKATGKRISQPTNMKEKRALALKKTGGRWKIFGIYGDLKPNVQRK